MKITDLEQVNGADGFDPEKDKLIVESGGSCHNISMSDISKILDIRRIESNRTAWNFIDLIDSQESLPATEVESGDSISYPYNIEPNSRQSLTLKIAGFEDQGRDPPTGAKRVMLMARAQNIELITRFRSQEISLFRIRDQESAVLFMLENIQDVVTPSVIIDSSNSNSFKTFPGTSWTSKAGGVVAKDFYENLNPRERSALRGPIFSDPNLMPGFNSENQTYTNLDPIDQVTIFLKNVSDSSGYINSIRTIAWSY
jgi:hypothetical protein